MFFQDFCSAKILINLWLDQVLRLVIFLIWKNQVTVLCIVLDGAYISMLAWSSPKHSGNFCTHRHSCAFHLRGWRVWRVLSHAKQFDQYKKWIYIYMFAVPRDCLCSPSKFRSWTNQVVVGQCLFLIVSEAIRIRNQISKITGSIMALSL